MRLKGEKKSKHLLSAVQTGAGRTDRICLQIWLHIKSLGAVLPECSRCLWIDHLLTQVSNSERNSGHAEKRWDKTGKETDGYRALTSCVPLSQKRLDTIASFRRRSINALKFFVSVCVFFLSHNFHWLLKGVWVSWTKRVSVNGCLLTMKETILPQMWTPKARGAPVTNGGDSPWTFSLVRCTIERREGIFTNAYPSNTLGGVECLCGIKGLKLVLMFAHKSGGNPWETLAFLQIKRPVQIRLVRDNIQSQSIGPVVNLGSGLNLNLAVCSPVPGWLSGKCGIFFYTGRQKEHEKGEEEFWKWKGDGEEIADELALLRKGTKSCSRV